MCNNYTVHPCQQFLSPNASRPLAENKTQEEERKDFLLAHCSAPDLGHLRGGRFISPSVGSPFAHTGVLAGGDDELPGSRPLVDAASDQTSERPHVGLGSAALGEGGLEGGGGGA